MINKFNTLIFIVSAFILMPNIYAQNKLIPQTVAFDPATAHTLSMVVPTTEGDANRNGTVEVFFRENGKGDWQESMALYRTNNGKGSSQPFAGMLFDLKENTTYEIKLIAKDPDGVEGNAEQIVTATTKKIPPRVKPENATEVSNFEELTKAINEIVPGSVVLINKGIYKGNVTVNNKLGTEEKPILIRGKDLSESIIQGTFTLSGSKFIHVENLTIKGAGTGFYLSNCASLVIRDNLILGVDNGMTAKGGHTNLYVSNNTFIGNNVFGDVSNATWNDEGIVITGMGHELVNNTLAGFGDAIGMSHRSSLKNCAIDMHHNLVLWSGDDGVEMDFTDRNAQAHHNLFTNSANGISCQMVWNGPGYVYKNVAYNVQRGPYKIKPERAGNDGLFIMNNTTIKPGMAFQNYSTEVDGLYFVNNLFVGTKNNELMMMGSHGSGIKNLLMDYNAWSQDGSFSIAGYGNAKNFNDWKTKHAQGNHDVLLEGQKIFDKLILDFDTIDFFTFRSPHQNFSLDKTSAAIDAGIIIPCINNKFSGKAPDIGAWEVGETPPQYGAFRGDTTPPSTPGNFKALAVSTTQIDLSWDVAKDSESGIIYYILYRNGKIINIIIGNQTFSDNKLEEGSEHTYELVAVNGGAVESKKTALIKISTLADTLIPELTSVTALGPNTQVSVTFNKVISKESAENKENYKLDNGIVIESAVLQSNSSSVILTTSTLKKDANYNLIVKNIQDIAKKPNKISDNSKKTFQFKELKTLINFGTKALGVKGFDKFMKDKESIFIKAGPGGIGPAAKSNLKDSNYQGIVSDTPRVFSAGEEIYVTWYNNSKAPISFTPKISFNHDARPNKGDWHEMSPLVIAPNTTGITMFKFNEKTAGSYKIVNVNCNIQTVANTLICHSIQLDSKE